MTKVEKITEKALSLDNLTVEEGLVLYEQLPLANLMELGNRIRQQLNPGNFVTWIIDRNVNITNACVSGCRFCNFYRPVTSSEVYVTTLDEYISKIGEMRRLGGNQLLLQGGMHPRLGLDFYTDLFGRLKALFPGLRLHALGPPEIVHLARMEQISYREVLERLTTSGMDSLPGAGAEILVDRVRKAVSPGKCSADEWLDVMRVAHKMDLTTSATMMFGHVETRAERLEHMVRLRGLQSERPAGHKGFLNFVLWPFQDEGTVLREKTGVRNTITPEEYIRTLAISRVMLPNIRHIQASWLTVGTTVAQLCLHSGADDLGSIMIEENVVSVAGAKHTINAAGMNKAIREAGFEPVQRDQDFIPV